MLDRRVAPPFNRNFNFSLIEPEEVTLPNGANIFFVKGGDQNVVKVDLIFPAGRWSETIWGSSYFATHLLPKGTSSKTSFEIASIFDRLGAHLDVGAGLDFVTLSLYSLTRNFLAALDLVAEILNYSVFSEKELQQLKSQYIQNLKVNQEKTSFLASKLFRKTLYGENHPYGKELEENDVNNLRRQDLIQFYQEYFKDFVVIAVGKIDDLNRTKIIETIASFPFQKMESKVYKTENFPNQRKHSNKDNSLQTSLRIGRKTIDRTHHDYPHLVFLNHIFGGYFGSRLMKNIREDKGLTYGIYSSVHAMKHDSYLVIGTDVNKETSNIAFQEVKNELQRLCTEKINDNELDTARYHFMGGFQTELSTTFAHAEKIKSIVLFNLKRDHYNNLLNKVNSVNATELLEIANKYFAPESFYEVSVG